MLPAGCRERLAHGENFRNQLLLCPWLREYLARRKRISFEDKRVKSGDFLACGNIPIAKVLCLSISGNTPCTRRHYRRLCAGLFSVGTTSEAFISLIIMTAGKPGIDEAP